MLEVKDLTVHFGDALILNRINLRVEERELVCILGPNGAGKTTLLRAISGLLLESKESHPRTSGTIEFKGKRIGGLKPWEIVKMNIVHCPERRRLFPEMTVLENLKMGAYLRKDKEGIKKDLEWIYKLFPILKERANQMSKTLSGGEQQMLAIARALMSKPKLLLIDEPSLGLAPILKRSMLKQIKEIQRSGVPILLVEQDISQSLDISNRLYILAHGDVVAEGDKEDMKNLDIRQIYLGL